MTANDRPAIVIDVLRAPPALADTVNATVPLPVPDVPLVIEIQETFADAVHAHPAPAVIVTATLLDPPAAPKFALPGAIAKLHAAAACDTVAVAVPIVSVAVRAPPLLVATENAAVPLPVPEPLVTVIHDASLCALQAHVAGDAVTDTDAGPPPAPTL